MALYSYFRLTWERFAHPNLTLTFSKIITDMPGDDENEPFCLVISESGHFDVVSYLYTDGTTRMFTNGDVPRPESDFVAWALLPDLNS